jgi:hypothetical protein
MADKFQGQVTKNVSQKLLLRSLYNMGGAQFVFPEPALKGELILESNNDFKDKKTDDALVVTIKSQGKEETLEIIDSPTRGAAVDQAYETYTGVIPFKVRPYYGDAEAGEKPEPTRRAKLAKSIVSKPAGPKVYTYYKWNVKNPKTGENDDDYMTREKVFQTTKQVEKENPRVGKYTNTIVGNGSAQLTTSKELRDINEMTFDFRAKGSNKVIEHHTYNRETDKAPTGHTCPVVVAIERANELSKELGKPVTAYEVADTTAKTTQDATVQDIPSDVAQNFTQQAGEQEVDGTGEPIWQIYQVSNGLVMSEITAGDQQEAAQALQDQLDDWATDDDVRELYAVRPKMAEQSTPQDATQQTGTWQLVDVTLNQPVETFQGTWAQADSIARQYETGPGDRNGHEISVRRA